jgi:hypothetical protein
MLAEKFIPMVKLWLTEKEGPSQIAAAYYGYHYCVGNNKKHSGITNDLQRRETEHQERWPGGRLIVAIGPISEARAMAWEVNQSKTITPPRR